MFDYSNRIAAFRDEKVRLSGDFLQKLLAHRQANRDRLVCRLPELVSGISVGDSSFRPQGSVAMQTVIQTRFADEEYDIDDGLLLWKHQLKGEDGKELPAAEVRGVVREALKDKRFSRQPKFCTNCIRVFYADEDEEKHHVDFPVYRRYLDTNGQQVRELAGETGWLVSDPTQVNRWFDAEIHARNGLVAGWGTQMRQLIQLLKRFCRSRREWDLPNGMKLTMLVAECQPAYCVRIDEAFRNLLISLNNRLQRTKVIQNLAHPDKPDLTRTPNDQNVVDLENRIGDALGQLATLDDADANNADSARSVWDWVFKSDGFFSAFDANRKREEKQNSLLAKAALVGSGARTSPAGILGAIGIPNLKHSFYGNDPVD